jgi:hypothetical protein
MQTRLFLPIFILVLLGSISSSAQNKIERQHRIKKTQFPSKALKTISENNKNVKRLKYYREIDTSQKTYTAKFKKARLFYEMNFNQNGKFESMGFKVKQVDIPEESFEHITNYIAQNFEKSKIRKMQQLYSINGNGSVDKTIKNAFQNLMVPTMCYKLLIRGKKVGTLADYSIMFDAEGNFAQIRKSLPTNHDRVLY